MRRKQPFSYTKRGFIRVINHDTSLFSFNRLHNFPAALRPQRSHHILGLTLLYSLIRQARTVIPHSRIWTLHRKEVLNYTSYLRPAYAQKPRPFRILPRVLMKYRCTTQDGAVQLKRWRLQVGGIIYVVIASSIIDASAKLWTRPKMHQHSSANFAADPSICLSDGRWSTHEVLMDEAEYQTSQKEVLASLLPWAMVAWSECRVFLCSH